MYICIYVYTYIYIKDRIQVELLLHIVYVVDLQQKQCYVAEA